MIVALPRLFSYLFCSTDRSGVGLALWCFVVCSARRFVVCLALCHFVLVFSILLALRLLRLGMWGRVGGRGEGDGLGAFRAFCRFVLVWVCRFPLRLYVTGWGFYKATYTHTRHNDDGMMILMMMLMIITGTDICKYI